MPDKRRTRRSEPLLLRFQAGSLFLPDTIAHRIENMYPVEEGTLRTVFGPVPFVPDTATGNRPFSQRFNQHGQRENPSEEIQNLPDDPEGLEGEVPEVVYSHRRPLYGPKQHGVYHCLLQNGERDVLLLHSGRELWEFRGWQRNWRQLLSDPASPHGLEDRLPDDQQPRFPTQFEATGDGVVIVPQDRQAYFYDGDTLSPLGFSARPMPPQPRGPDDSEGSVELDSDKKITGLGVNDIGYAHDGLYFATEAKLSSGMTYGFGKGHIGTLVPINGPITTQNITTGAGTSTETTTNTDVVYPTGWMASGEWRCKVQYVDRYGNLSALSEASEGVTFSTQSAQVAITDPLSSSIEDKFTLDFLRKQIAWEGIPTGPEHCTGRILYRTKDLNNVPDPKFYELSINTSPVATAFATIPDNVTTFFPDNVPDAGLFLEAQEVDPVPKFKLCRMAFGRLWIANIENAPGLIRASMPNRWGTFTPDMKLFPDPDGGEITGLWRTNQGLLAFTRTSSFLITVSSEGTADQGFRTMPLAMNVGCEAPNSLQTLPNGTVLWLGADGFYAYDGNNVSLVSETLSKKMRENTKTRLKQACSVFDPRTREYRCWVSTNGSDVNNMCYVYSSVEKGWRMRTDIAADDVCVTKDHRDYVLAGGIVGGDSTWHSGVYLLDHATNRGDEELAAIVDEREAVVETGWLTSDKSLRRKTAYVLYLWLRETEDSDLTIEVMRDWRDTTIETVTTKRYSGEDPPNFWGKTKLGTKGSEFVVRRPYWTRAQIYVPSNEVFKFRIKGTGFWEFAGIQIDDASRDYGGAQVPP